MALRQSLLVLLVLAVLASALGVAYSKHQSRRLFVGLQALYAERDALGVEWGRLQLEQSTLATPIRIENMARQRLGMFVPAADRIAIIKQ
jgi:cell division protein FtsL